MANPQGADHMASVYNNEYSTIALQAGRVETGANITQTLHFNGQDPNQKYSNITQSASNKFTGRKPVLDHLEACLLPKGKSDDAVQELRLRTFVLYGLGGSGKTEIALKFGELHHQKFWGRFLIDGSDLSSIQRSYCQIAELFAKLAASSVSAEAGKIRLASKPQDDFYLIFDGVRDPEISSKLPEYLPAGRGAVLITTLNPEVAKYASNGMSQRLEDMDMGDSIDLLLAHAGIDVADEMHKQQVMPLVKSLQQLPLAVRLAGEAIRKSSRVRTGHVAIEEYMKDYAVTLKRLPLHYGSGDWGAGASDDSVFAAWEVSFSAIISQNASIRSNIEEILAVSAYFHHQKIPLYLLAQAPNRDWFSVLAKAIRGIHSWFAFSATTPPTRERSQLEAALSALDDYSLITLNGETGEVSMHGLVHRWVRFKFGSRVQTWSYEAARISLHHCVQIGDTEEHHRRRRRLYPHIRCFTDDEHGPLEIAHLESLRGIMNFAQVAVEAGNFEMSRELYNKSLDFARRNVGPRSATSLEIVERLGTVLEKQGLYKEAIKKALMVVQWRSNILGAGDPATLQALANLGLALQGRGKYSRARAVNQRVLSRLTNKGTSEATINLAFEVKNNQASVLQRLGEYGEAELLSREVLELRESAPGLGANHPDTMDTVDTLALILEKQEKWEESKAFAERAFSQRRDILGEDHPDTLMSLSRKASVLSRQGEWAAAQDLQTQVFNSRKKILGLNHPDTVTSFNHLAANLLALGNYKAAEEAFKGAESGYTEAFREGGQNSQRNHPFLSIVRSNLAVCLRKQGKNCEAEELYQEVLSGYDDPHHPDALICRENLAVLLRQEGKLREAEEKGREVLSAYEQKDGSSSVSASRALYSLACTIARHEERHEEAEIITRMALKGLEHTLGQRSHEVLTAMAQLGHVLRCRGKFRESWREFERACSGFESLGVKKHWSFTHFSALREAMASEGLEAPLPQTQSEEIQHSEEGEASNLPSGEVEPRAGSVHKRPYVPAVCGENETGAKRLKTE